MNLSDACTTPLVRESVLNYDVVQDVLKVVPLRPCKAT